MGTSGTNSEHVSMVVDLFYDHLYSIGNTSCAIIPVTGLMGKARECVEDLGIFVVSCGAYIGDGKRW